MKRNRLWLVLGLGLTLLLLLLSSAITARAAQAQQLRVGVDTMTTQWSEHRVLADSTLIWMMQYIDLLDLRGYTYYVKFDKLEDEEGEWSGWSEVVPEYRKVLIEFNLDQLAKRPRWFIHDTIRHELLHVLVWRLAALAYDLSDDDSFAIEQIRKTEEELVTVLAGALLWQFLLIEGF